MSSIFRKAQQCVALKLLVLLQVISYPSEIICNMAEMAARGVDVWPCLVQVSAAELGLAPPGLQECHSPSLFTPCLGPHRMGSTRQKMMRRQPHTSLAHCVIQLWVAISYPEFITRKEEECAPVALHTFQAVFLNDLNSHGDWIASVLLSSL